MSEGGRESVLDRWRRESGVGRFKEFTVSPVPADSPSSCVYASDVVEASPGCCEYATGVPFVGALGRTCSVDGCFCPASVFKVAEVFADCSSRVEQLKKEKEHQ